MEEYQQQFKLKALMLVKNVRLCDKYFIFSFLSGLEEEVSNMVVGGKEVE